MKHIKQYEQYYNNQKPIFEIGDKVYATNINTDSNLKYDTEYTINNYTIYLDEIYYEIKELPKPNNYNQIRFSTPFDYFQMKYNI